MNPNRRALIQGIATCTLGACAAAPLKPMGPQRRVQSMGVILGSVRHALGENPAATLQHLAKEGFKELEFVGPPRGVAAEDFKKMILDSGMTPVAGGAAMFALQNDLPAIIESAHFFGRKYVVCYWPWADKGLNKQIADWKALGGELNALGTTLKKEGLRLAFHNHDPEFAVTEGQIPYDVVLAETDPDLVSMELDIYWIHKGHQDAAKYVLAHPGRFSLFHVKDMGPAPERTVVCVGDGTLAFDEVFAALEGQPGERHFFWELEGRTNAQMELQCATKTARVLTKMRF